MRKGAKLKLTETRIKVLCKAIELGLPQQKAAILAGISETTFYYWKSKGENAKRGIYRSFWESLKKAQAQAEIRHLKNIAKHALGGMKIVETKTTTNANGSVTTTVTEKEAPGSWQSSAWWLERKYPERYGRNRNVETEDNKPLPWSDTEDAPDPLGMF
jgi:hypothetical protein